jgi:hypothetical protein
MELCSDGEDSRGSNSNNVRPGVMNNPLLPQPLENWHIVVRKSNGGSCIFPSWKDYRANLSSLFETSRSSTTEQDGIELAAFPTISQAMDYLKRNPTKKSSLLPSPSSSPLLPPLQLGITTTGGATAILPPFTALPNSKRGGRPGVNNHHFIQQSQSESCSQHHPRAQDPHHPHNNNKTDAIPAVVTTLLNAAFSDQESDGGGRGNKSNYQPHSLTKNVPAANTIEIIDSDRGTPDKVTSDKTKTTVSPTMNDTNEVGRKKKKRKKRDLFGKNDTATTTFEIGTHVKRMRKETPSKTTAMGTNMDTSTNSDKPDTTSLNALAMAAIASANSSSKRIIQRQLHISPPTVINKGNTTKPRARSPPTVIVRDANVSCGIKRGRRGEDTSLAAMRRSPTNGIDNSNSSVMQQHHLRQHQYMQQQQEQRRQQKQKRTPSTLSLKIPEVPRGFVPVIDIHRTVSDGMDISSNSSSSINTLRGSINSRNDANFHQQQQQQLLLQQYPLHGNLLLQRAQQQQQQRPPQPQPQPKHDYQQLYNYQQTVDLTATDDSETIDSDSTKIRRNLTNRPSRFSPSWTISDDSLLTKIVKRTSSNSKDSQSYPTDWESIAKALGNNKGAKECEIHWVRYLMRGSRGGFWTEAEDKIIFEAVANESSNYDTTNATGATWKKEHATWKKQQPFRKGFWTTLSKRLNGRDSKQTRDRWFGILNPIINHRPFTPAEDIKLWEAYNILGRKWADISESYFNLTRSERVLNNRFRHSLYMDFINSKYGPNAYLLATAAREESNEQ